MNEESRVIDCEIEILFKHNIQGCFVMVITEFIFYFKIPNTIKITGHRFEDIQGNKIDDPVSIEECLKDEVVAAMCELKAMETIGDSFTDRAIKDFDAGMQTKH